MWRGVICKSKSIGWRSREQWKCSAEAETLAHAIVALPTELASIVRDKQSWHYLVTLLKPESYEHCSTPPLPGLGGWVQMVAVFSCSLAKVRECRRWWHSTTLWLGWGVQVAMKISLSQPKANWTIPCPLAGLVSTNSCGILPLLT